MAPEQISIKILKSLVESPKTNRELLYDLSYGVKQFNVIDKPLKKLKLDEIILSKKIDSSGPGAKPTQHNVNPDIKTLTHLVYDVYDDESRSDLMTSEYFHNMFQTVIDYFEANTNYKLSDQDLDFLSLVLRYSQTSLKLILSDKYSEKLESIGENMDMFGFGHMDVDALYKSAIMETLNNPERIDKEIFYDEVLKCVRKKMKKLKQMCRDNQNNHYLKYVFKKFFDSDLFGGKIPISTSFSEDYRKIIDILNECDYSAIY